MRFNIVVYSVSGIIGLIISFLFGRVDGLLIALFAVIVIDYITGVIGACIKKNLSSEISIHGLLRKFLMIVLVAFAHIVDAYILNDEYILRNITITLFFANDGISIIENIAILGIPIPKKLKDILYQLKDKGDK